MTAATVARPTPATIAARKPRRVLCPVGEFKAILSGRYLRYVLGETTTRPDTRA